MRKPWLAAAGERARWTAPCGRSNVRQGAQNRIGAARLGQRHVAPAEFAHRPQVVRRPESPGQHLAAQADAQHRAIRRRIVGHQPGQPWQIRVRMVIGRGLFAAEHNQRVGIHRLGQRLARPGLPQVDLGGGLVQGHADLAVMGDAGVFDDGDAHGVLRTAGHNLHGAGRVSSPRCGFQACHSRDRVKWGTVKRTPPRRPRWRFARR
jgi:hypothetical protein